MEILQRTALLYVKTSKYRSKDLKHNFQQNLILLKLKLVYQLNTATNSKAELLYVNLIKLSETVTNAAPKVLKASSKSTIQPARPSKNYLATIRSLTTKSAKSLGFSGLFFSWCLR
jgi:hypothetical protein